jgi:hypothetical protein
MNALYLYETPVWSAIIIIRIFLFAVNSYVPFAVQSSCGWLIHDVFWFQSIFCSANKVHLTWFTGGALRCNLIFVMFAIRKTVVFLFPFSPAYAVLHGCWEKKCSVLIYRTFNWELSTELSTYCESHCILEHRFFGEKTCAYVDRRSAYLLLVTAEIGYVTVFNTFIICVKSFSHSVKIGEIRNSDMAGWCSMEVAPK